MYLTIHLSHDRPVVQGYPNGCQHRFTSPAEAKALPHEGASALVKVGNHHLWFLQEVQGLWEGYEETYAKLEPMRQNLAMYMQDQSDGHKRKLAELQSEGERLMADAQR